jgi:hypothetical protein
VRPYYVYVYVRVRFVFLMLCGWIRGTNRKGCTKVASYKCLCTLIREHKYILLLGFPGQRRREKSDSSPGIVVAGGSDQTIVSVSKYTYSAFCSQIKKYNDRR